MKLVKVARVGSKVKEVALSDNATIGSALSAAGYTKMDDEDIFRNHIISTAGFPVSNNDVVILENKKIDPLKKQIIDIMILGDIIDSYDFENENGYIDYDSMECEFGVTIDSIITAVRV